MKDISISGVGETAVETTPDVGVATVGEDLVSSAGEILVAVPAYNEAAMIGEVVRTAAVHADTVLVVDDGSSDKTGQAASEAGASVARHPKNRGYGGALKTIFKEAARRDPAHLVIIDADGQHDPQDVASLVAAREDTQADLVIGSRYSTVESDIPAYRRLGLWVVNEATNLSLGTRGDARIRDTQSGLRAYSPRAYHMLAATPTIGDGMSASTDILYHVVRSGMTVVEIGAAVRYDLADTSTENPLVHGVELMANIARLSAIERPMTVLLLPAVLATLVGMPFARRFKGPRRALFGRWTGTTMFGALVGLLAYLLLTRPRAVPADAEQYELQVRRELTAEDGGAPDIDVTKG